MTSKYRVEYALKSHRRDQLIEWMKGLLAVPFVLYSQPAAAYDNDKEKVAKMAPAAARRYAEIMLDVEGLIQDHSSQSFVLSFHCAASLIATVAHQNDGTDARSKLKFLVPSVGSFFTPLPLKRAFLYQDERRKISARRFVPPSFNDIRLTFNTAQMMALAKDGWPELITFDGDLTLYEDGKCLTAGDVVISRIVRILSRNIAVAVVTAAGYTEASRYYSRLSGLLEAIKDATLAGDVQGGKFIIMGGESQYLFLFDLGEKYLLRMIPRSQWKLDVMKNWTKMDIKDLLDAAQEALSECIENLGLPAIIVRKSRAVGIVPKPELGARLTREQLEETVLVTQQRIEMMDPAVPFSAFNGGSDIFVDIGGKDLGVLVCREFFGNISADKTIHCGDQFLSLSSSNDFRARLVCTTAWVANPPETVALLDEMQEHVSNRSDSQWDVVKLNA